jgi:hypothetical protein
LSGEINLFTASIDGSHITPITNGLDGYNYLQDISPDGTKILVASNTNYGAAANLYIIELSDSDSEPLLIASELPNSVWTSAAHWIDDSRFIYIAKGEAGLGIYISDTNGNTPINIYKNTSGLEQGNPVEILAVNDAYVYWGGETRVKEGNRTFVSSYAWSSSIDGAETIKLEFNEQQIRYSYLGKHDLIFSPDSKTIAWTEKATPESGPPYHNYLHIAPISDINNPYTLEVLSGNLSLTWFPDGSRILIFDQGSLQHSMAELVEFYKQNPDSSLARSFESLYGVYEVTISPDLPVKNYNLPADMMSWQSNSASAIMDLYDISPDNRQILVSIYEEDVTAGYVQRFGFLSLESYTFSEVEDFHFLNTVVGGTHWIP